MNEFDDDQGIFDEAGFEDDVNQFLTFVLNGEEYGIPILKVHEIRGFSPVTPIPNTPPFIRGAINLRGKVIPVIDLRERLSMPTTEPDRFAVIIVVTVGTRTMGLIVDAVSDVLNVGDENAAPPPELGADVDTSFLTGMARAEDKLVLLLDIDAVLGEAASAALPAA